MGRVFDQLVNEPGSDLQVLVALPAGNLQGAMLKGLEAPAQRIPVKIIHPIRNPYDTIASMFYRGWAKNDLGESAGLYFDTFDLNTKMRALGLPWFELKLEDLIADPKLELAKLCHFLEQEINQRWLETCAGVVFKQPRRMRDKVKWPDEVAQLIARETQKRESLRWYGEERC